MGRIFIFTKANEETVSSRQMEPTLQKSLRPILVKTSSAVIFAVRFVIKGLI